MKISNTYNLAVCYPELAVEWDWEENGELTPQNVAPHSNKKVGWKCSTCRGEMAGNNKQPKCRISMSILYRKASNQRKNRSRNSKTRFDQGMALGEKRGIETFGDF